MYKRWIEHHLLKVRLLLNNIKVLVCFLLVLFLWGCKNETTLIPRQLSVWHSFEMGSIKEKVLTTLIQNFITGHPEWDVEVTGIPFDRIDQRFRSEVISGAGPDLFIDRNDKLGELVRSGLIADITGETRGKLDKTTKQGLDGVIYEEKTFGVPFASHTDILYYNRDLVPDPPRTSDDLLMMVSDGALMTLHVSAYHLFGWPGAFGGELLDDAGQCIADQGGWLEAANFLLALKDAGVVFSEDFTATEAPFRLGESAFMVNGPWALESYQKDLGDRLGAVPLPSGLKTASPLMGLYVVFINPNTEDPKSAVELALFLAEQESQTLFMDFAKFIPVRTDVSVNDEMIQAFVVTDSTATVRPQESVFTNFWLPFDKMWVDILVNDEDPSEAITAACIAMNTANNK